MRATDRGKGRHGLPGVFPMHGGTAFEDVAGSVIVVATRIRNLLLGMGSWVTNVVVPPNVVVLLRRRSHSHGARRPMRRVASPVAWRRLDDPRSPHCDVRSPRRPTMRGRRCRRSGRTSVRHAPRTISGETSERPSRSREAVLVADLVALSIPILGRSSHDGRSVRGRAVDGAGAPLPAVGRRLGEEPRRRRQRAVAAGSGGRRSLSSSSSGARGASARPSRRNRTSPASALASRTAPA